MSRLRNKPACDITSYCCHLVSLPVTGSNTVKVLPLPSVLWALMLPWCASTILFTMASPETGTDHLPGILVLDPVKPVKYPLQILFWNSIAGIFNTNLQVRRFQETRRYGHCCFPVNT